jgi:hypothetical protein
MGPWVALLAVWLVAVGTLAAEAPSVESVAKAISSLIDPVKLATLGERGANPRVQKYVALLADAKAKGAKPGKVAKRAVALVGMKGPAAKLTVEAMVQNLRIAEKSGCTDAEGLRDLRKGQAATVRRGDHQGDELSVDHTIPRSVVPELDNVIANLELVPLKGNKGKRAKIGERQMERGRKLHEAGLLNDEGLKKLEAAWSRERGAGEPRSEVGNQGSEGGGGKS